MNNPKRTGTFFFTDIEGSTRLWESMPDSMRTALHQHDQLVRGIIESNLGEVFKTVGDAFCAFFDDPEAAVRAALRTQHDVGAQEWPKGCELKLRIALHTGVAEVRESDYFGQPLNRTARILSAGHGGQILISRATYELVRSQMVQDVSFKELGTYRLRDLGLPETIFQVGRPGKEEEFPDLKTLENPETPNNLAGSISSFIGRDRELIELAAVLREIRLVTVAGAGGTGKSRLAQQVAADALEEFQDGVWVIDCSQITETSTLVGAISGVLRLNQVSHLSDLYHAISDQELLFVLDNCEHILNLLASVVEPLLQHCSKLKMLLTSREPLRIAGEYTYRLQPLSTPKPGTTYDADTLSQFESVRLFIERAEFHDPGFTLLPNNVAHLASICCRLDGIPFALELAASRLRSLTIAEIDARLDQRFKFLTSSNRTAAPRQQTLRALIDWSYDTLTDSEKSLLQRLAIFSGGWNLDEAEAICSSTEIESWEILDLNTSLHDKSLIFVQDQIVETRYNLLESVRQYALDQLAAAGREDDYRRKHATFFAGFCESLNSNSATKVYQNVSPALLRNKLDNIRAALQFFETRPDQGHYGVVICAAMGRFWNNSGFIGEARQWFSTFEEFLDDPNCVHARVTFLTVASWLAHLEADTESANRYSDRLLESDKSPEAQSSALSAKALIAQHHEANLENARSLYYQGLEQALKSEQVRPRVVLSLNLGSVCRDLGLYDEARKHLMFVVEHFRSAADLESYAMALMALGRCYMYQEDYETGLGMLMSAMKACTEGELYGRLAGLWVWIAQCQAADGDLDGALHSVTQSLEAMRTVRTSLIGDQVNFTAGWVHALTGNSQSACEHLKQGLDQCVRSRPRLLGGFVFEIAAMLALKTDAVGQASICLSLAQRFREEDEEFMHPYLSTRHNRIQEQIGDARPDPAALKFENFAEAVRWLESQKFVS